MNQRAYATLQIKSFDEQRRTFKGVATTPTADRMGDVVEPRGARFALPLPLLWQHDHADPIGWVRAAKITATGIEVEGEVAAVPEAGPLRDRLDHAWQAMRAGLVRGLSIGFRGLKDGVEVLKDNSGLRFRQWEWLELSAVTIPANAEATISAIKTAAQAAPPPGVPGATAKPAAGGPVSSRKGQTMKTLNEQLAELQADKATKVARMGEIAKTLEAEGRKSFSAEERTEFDDLRGELEQIDDQIRIKEAQLVNSAGALPVAGKSYLESRQAPAVIKKDKDDSFKGQSFVRMVVAKALASQANVSAAAVAEHRYGKSNPRLVEWIKAGEVAGGGTLSGEWGTELQRLDGLFTGDFIEFLHGRTLFDRLPLREVPANVTIKGQDGAATGYWVGESQPIPVSAQDFSTTNLRPLKVAALAVISNELIRDSSPSAEMLVRDALTEASAQRIDGTFFSTTAASSNVSPAGLLNGLTAGTSAGTTAANLRADIAGLYAGFLSDKNATGLVFVMTPTLAKQISLMMTDLGQPEFSGMMGGSPTLHGDPVYTGDNVGAGDFILMKPSDIYKIGDGGVQVSVSREAVIEMSSAPNAEGFGPTAAGEALVSMFQTENTAIKIVRSINYAKRRSGCVRFIGDADYGSSTSWDRP
jgi:HK97 family phage prohead protease